MLTKIDRRDVPGYTNREPSELRRFAEDQLDKFMCMANVGDVAELSGEPDTGDTDPVKHADKVMQVFRSEAFRLDLRKKVRCFRRGPRMFLERTEPLVVKPVPMNVVGRVNR